MDTWLKTVDWVSLSVQLSGSSIFVWLGEASETGTLELLQKARGAKKSLQAAYEELIKAGYAGGRIVMAHRSNEKFCQQLSELLREKYPQAEIKILPTSGLCSFYAEDGGLLMGYEIG